MPDITESQFFSWTNQVFKSNPAQTNNLYHEILDIIKTNDPQQAAANILGLIERDQADIKLELESKTAEGEITTSFSPQKGSFRRVIE